MMMMIRAIPITSCTRSTRMGGGPRTHARHPGESDGVGRPGQLDRAGLYRLDHGETRGHPRRRVIPVSAPAAPRSAPESLGNAGGRSGAHLWRYESDAGAVAARAWPPARPGRAALERVHGWLAEAAGLAFIPVPYPALDGRTLLEADGRLWEVAPWMPGEADSGRPPAPARLHAGFVALGQLHRRWERHRVIGRSRGLAVRAREIDALLEGGFDDLQRAVPSEREGDSRTRLAGEWLALARELAPRLSGTARLPGSRTAPSNPAYATCGPITCCSGEIASPG